MPEDLVDGWDPVSAVDEIARLQAEVTRLQASHCPDCQHPDPDRLRAELEAARALYVGAQEDLNEAVGRIVGLRTELAALVELSGTWGGRALRAEAKLARVRELCVGVEDGRPGVALTSEQVLAAIEGEQT